MIITYDPQKTQFDLYFSRDIADVLNHVLTQIRTFNSPQTPEQTVAAIAQMFRLDVSEIL